MAYACVLACALPMAACVGFSPDGGMAPVSGLVADRLGRDVVKLTDDAAAADAESRVAALLRRPLRARDAVEVALLRNKDLQAAFNDLGVSEADYVTASLPPEPTLSVNFVAGQGDVEVISQVVVALYALATLPARQAIAAEGFHAAQLRAAGRVMALAADVERQYYVALAARERIGFLDQALTSAQASAEYAKQLGAAGNLNKLEQARQDVFYVELGAQGGDAKLAAQAEREKLTRLMGLWGADIAYALPKAMPALPKAMPALPGSIGPPRDIERQALEKRLDLAAGRRDLDALARRLGLSVATRYLGDFTITAQNDHENAGRTGGSVLATETQGVLSRSGFVADLKIPIYDWGESKVRDARETYLAAANRLAQRAIDARSQVREAWLRARGKYDLAKYYADRVLPLRKTILAQTSLQTNGGLTDVSQLLLDARGGIGSNVTAIEAKRDFFIAAADLTAALVGVGPAFETPSSPARPAGAAE